MRLHVNATLCASLLFGPVACGSAARPPITQTTVMPATGAERTSPPAKSSSASVAETSPGSAGAQTGPTKLTVEARVHGQSVAADVRVLGIGGDEVARGRTGEVLPVMSGEYEMQVTIRDASALADKPMQRRTISLARGADVHEHVDFAWSMVQLNVIVNGVPDETATVHLMRHGAEVAALNSGAEPVAISPGRYSAKVQTRGGSSDVSALVFPDGMTQVLPMRLQM